MYPIPYPDDNAKRCGQITDDEEGKGRVLVLHHVVAVVSVVLLSLFLPSCHLS